MPTVHALVCGCVFVLCVLSMLHMCLQHAHRCVKYAAKVTEHFHEKKNNSVFPVGLVIIPNKIIVIKLARVNGCCVVAVVVVRYDPLQGSIVVIFKILGVLEVLERARASEATVVNPPVDVVFRFLDVAGSMGWPVADFLYLSVPRCLAAKPVVTDVTGNVLGGAAKTSLVADEAFRIPPQELYRLHLWGAGRCVQD